MNQIRSTAGTSNHKTQSNTKSKPQHFQRPVPEQNNFLPTNYHKNPTPQYNTFLRTNQQTWQSENQVPSSFQPNYKPHFPSQPISIRAQPVKNNFPTNRQVFGSQKNVFHPKNAPRPTNLPEPMSTSSRLPSRQISQRYNYFNPSGPRNFVSEELTNINFEDEVDQTGEYEKYSEQNLENYENHDNEYQIPPHNDDINFQVTEPSTDTT